MLATTPIHNAILNRLNYKEDGTPRPVEFYDTEVPDEQSLPTSAAGFVKPYGLVYFSQPVRAAVGRGIVSTRRDTNRAGLTVQINSHRPGDGRLIADTVKDLLVGFIPPDSTELILEGGASGDNRSGTTRPTMYMQYMTFSYYCNLITP